MCVCVCVCVREREGVCESVSVCERYRGCEGVFVRAFSCLCLDRINPFLFEYKWIRIGCM